ncbi:MAG: hypothetical protein ACRC5S_00200 [Cetobacterium sp.]
MINLLKKYNFFPENIELPYKDFSFSKTYENASIIRTEASNSNNSKLFEVSSNLFEFCYIYCLKEYMNNNKSLPLVQACFFKYEALKGYFTSNYLQIKLSNKDLLLFLDNIINFLEELLEHIKDNQEFKNLYEKYHTLVFSEKLNRCHIKIDYAIENSNLDAAKSESRISFDLSKNLIDILKRQALDGIIDSVHYKIEELNYNMRLAFYYEICFESLVKNNLDSAISNLLKAIKYNEMILELSSDHKQAIEKKEKFFQTIKNILTDKKNTDFNEFNILCNTFKDNDFFKKIIFKFFPTESNRIFSNNYVDNSIYVDNKGGNFNNSGILGNHNSSKKNIF